MSEEYDIKKIMDDLRFNITSKKNNNKIADELKNIFLKQNQILDKFKQEQLPKIKKERKPKNKIEKRVLDLTINDDEVNDIINNTNNNNNEDPKLKMFLDAFLKK